MAKDLVLKKVSIREDVCIGCGLCRVYCQAEHSQSKDLIKAFKRESPRPLPLIRVERKGELSFVVQCRHCAKSWCTYYCLTGAMHRNPVTGVVDVDREKCIGCWTCIVACPYGALTRDMKRNAVAKCDLCPGQDIPICVVNCPNEALTLFPDGEER